MCLNTKQNNVHDLVEGLESTGPSRQLNVFLLVQKVVCVQRFHYLSGPLSLFRFSKKLSND